MLSDELLISLDNSSSIKYKRSQIKDCISNFISIIIESLNINIQMDYYYIFNHIIIVEIVKYIEAENLIDNPEQDCFKKIFNHSQNSEIFRNLFFYDQILEKIKQSLNKLNHELESTSQKHKLPEKNFKKRFLIRKPNPSKFDTFIDGEKIFLKSSNCSINDDRWLGIYFIKFSFLTANKRSCLILNEQRKS